DRASDLALRIDRWHTARLIARIEKAIEAAGLDPAGLAVPAASDDDALYSSYCPRCLCRYQKEAGECPDCAGIALVRMP
ncbi:MAG: hypothetical protein HGA24_03480, partial [Candidatus Aminicenantes bacterium]|nr:hypothetical protein [Candidatus Aminicenantes bacterium]